VAPIFPKRDSPTNTITHQSNEKFVSINCLEYVTIVINYYAALNYYARSSFENNGSYPVVLCITDSMSVKKWTTHMSKMFFIGQALARFFIVLLIGSSVGIKSLWINTKNNLIADEISRLNSVSTNQDLVQLQPMITLNSNRTMWH
jgi:hypothetical protein